VESLKNIKASAEKFMSDIDMHHAGFDLNKMLDDYLDEMKKGLQGRAMLPMMPTYISGNLVPKRGVSALAVDVGGTNLRLALIRIDDDNEAKIAMMKKAPLPGLSESIGKDAFFNTIAAHIVPYLKYTSMISFSFAHEVIHTENMDGRVYVLSKELHIDGIKDELLGENLKRALNNKGHYDFNIVVLNDTVGVAACASYKTDMYDSFIGVVLGTGSNTCYIEKTCNITKVDQYHAERMIVNVESAEFNLIRRGKCDKVLDIASEMPKSALLEKMVSGRYIGNLFWYTLNEAIRKGLLTQRFADEFSKQGIKDTIAMSDFLQDPYGDNDYAKMCFCEQDVVFASTVADLLVVRGAKLVAIEIAGAAIKTGCGKDAKRPICVICEGTTYYTLKGIKAEIEKLVETWIAKEKNVYCKTIKVEDAALVGTGVIGLSVLD
jgi:hexokinase